VPRANRYHIPGCIWHITHRCHKREFLLKFARDRRRWMHWLFEARKRYGLTVLNHMVTSNHVHLLVVDGEDESTIPRSLQLVAGRTAQEYNLRKGRKGAFWEDRYHATAVGSGGHLRRCMAYIDLNMCRAGKVEHPLEWECCGYHAIQDPPLRYRIIDRERAAELLGYASAAEFVAGQRDWVAAWQDARTGRESDWSESVAVGSKDFVSDIQKRLDIRARHRQVDEDTDRFILHETRASYTTISEGETKARSAENTFPWRLTDL